VVENCALLASPFRFEAGEGFARGGVVLTGHSDLTRIAPAPIAEVCESRLETAIPRSSYRIAALSLLLILLAVNYRLLTGKASPVWDAFDYFGPYYSLIADHARQAQVLLWNPWISAGSPDFAEPELGTLSPVQILVGAVAGGTRAGFVAYWLLIWYLGGVGLLLLARHLRAPAWGALVAVLGFAFSGFFVGHAQHTSSLYSMAALPWLVWRLDVALTGKRWLPAVQAGALWGLSALGGYPQLTILSGGFVVLWAGLRLWCAESSAGGGFRRPSPLFVAAALVGFAAVGLLVLAPSYVGFFSEAAGYSDRAGPRLREICTISNALPAGALATFASPYLAILMLFNRDLWTFTDVAMVSIYMGAAVSVLASFALLSRPRSRWRWGLAGVAGLFVLCSLGKDLPVRGWLYDWVAPTRYFRNAAMFSAYAIFIAAVLALFASRDLASAMAQGGSRIWKRLLVAAATTSLGAIIAYSITIHRVANRGNRFSQATVCLLITWTALTVSAAGGWIWPRLRQLAPALLVTIAIADALFVNTLAGSLARSGPGFVTNIWNRVSSEHVSSLELTEGKLQRQLRPPAWLNEPLFPSPNNPDRPPIALNNRNLWLKVPVYESYNTLSNRFFAASGYEPVLAAMATGEHRIWFSPDVASVALDDAAYHALVERSRVLQAPVLVVHPPREMAHVPAPGRAGAQDARNVEAIMRLPAARQVNSRVLYYWPNRLALEVDCPQSGWLLVTDRWAPGWRATVNGEAAEVFGGDFVYRALHVKAGRNQVRFDYRPQGWPLLLFLSWGTLAVVLGWSLHNALAGSDLSRG
jgi:hypothetical protein